MMFEVFFVGGVFVVGLLINNRLHKIGGFRTKDRKKADKKKAEINNWFRQPEKGR